MSSTNLESLSIPNLELSEKINIWLKMRQNALELFSCEIAHHQSIVSIEK